MALLLALGGGDLRPREARPTTAKHGKTTAQERAARRAKKQARRKNR
jgi:hypothetical protein